ncbi:hypothetical protein DSM106972_077060 [Dulcicalothrix desertica PCC 7102]|uniref:Lasso peptide n=1 Tax=Dulcicalothrix desertica PCC 7102 TaxID=232991 RepID=A0A433V2F8_9CYAN|nr:lasso peptide [Dulcicalothrix desertica]RUT00258.1 hypothetical protein DSM106972_077060 [Dulcicalothrix desertica PCC 7102]TWH55724.1 hypothetical protein CAL7102_03889 [Dulcicalothrix desertica PCC 7102]
MKRIYDAPKLASYGDITVITQITGDPKRTDFLFSNGEAVSGANDIGSKDVCLGSPDSPNADCDPRF